MLRGFTGWYFLKDYSYILENHFYFVNVPDLAAYSSLSFNANISYTPMANNDLLEIQQQKVDKAKSIIVDHLNINSIRNKFIFAESIVSYFRIKAG